MIEPDDLGAGTIDEPRCLRHGRRGGSVQSMIRLVFAVMADGDGADVAVRYNSFSYKS